jgi:hypothetical protein
MKQYLTRVACLLPFLLSSCMHKSQVQNQTPLAPPIDDGPVPASNSAPQNLPPPVISTPPAQQPATTAQNNQDQPKPKPTHKKPAKPASTSTGTGSSTTQAADKTGTPPANQQASSGAPAVSAIGELSSGEPADLRTDTVNSLNATEHSLKTLNRKLNDQEEKTSAQITEYIKQARAALASNDLDGAHTLATKARLLLAELTQ